MISFPPSSIIKYTSANGSTIMLEKFILKHAGIQIPKKKITKKVPITDSIKYAQAGVKNEKNAIKMYEVQTGVQIYPAKSMNIIHDNMFQIKGRCDGITIIDDIQYVVEVKTRSTNNFGMTRQERIQCMCYCHASNIPGLVFIEYGKNEELLVTKYNTFLEDTKFAWDMIILDLELVCNCINMVKSNPDKFVDNQGLKQYETFLIIPWF